MKAGTVKLQKRLTDEVDGKKYYKYVVVLPKKKVEELEWEEVEDLKAEIEEEKLILEPKD